MPVPMSSRLLGGRSPNSSSSAASTPGLVEIEGAHVVPARRLGGEVARRLLVARGAHRGEALAVERELGILVRQHAAEIAGEPRAGPAMGATVEHPAALAKALEQARIGQELEVARDPGLALAEHLGELADGPFALAAEHEQAQPARLGGGAQAAEQGVEAVGLLRHDQLVG